MSGSCWRARNIEGSRVRTETIWGELNSMKIEIIGSEKVRGDLQQIWARGVHQFFFSSRHPNRLNELVEKAGLGAYSTASEELPKKLPGARVIKAIAAIGSPSSVFPRDHPVGPGAKLRAPVHSRGEEANSRSTTYRD